MLLCCCADVISFRQQIQNNRSLLICKQSQLKWKESHSCMSVVNESDENNSNSNTAISFAALQIYLYAYWHRRFFIVFLFFVVWPAFARLTSIVTSFFSSVAFVESSLFSYPLKYIYVFQHFNVIKFKFRNIFFLSAFAPAVVCFYYLFYC